MWQIVGDKVIDPDGKIRFIIDSDGAVYLRLDEGYIHVKYDNTKFMSGRDFVNYIVRRCNEEERKKLQAEEYDRVKHS